MKQRHPDDLLLWDAALELIRSGSPDLAIPVLRKAIKGSFSAIQGPLEFLNQVTIQTPSQEQIQSLKAYDTATQQALKHRNFDEAGDRYDQYIKALQAIFEEGESDEMRKRLFGRLLKTSYESQPATGLVHEQATPYTIAESQVYTTTEAAEIINVSDQTIRRMCEKGKFPEAYKTEGGHWRVPKKYFKISLEQARERKENIQPLKVRRYKQRGVMKKY